MQIEQFIESIFPTQDPKKIKAESAAKAATENGGPDVIETFYLVLSVVSIMTLMGALMVRSSRP